MKYYANIGGNSNVISYAYGATFITVQFSSGRPYTYSYDSAGKDNVEHMKTLADSGVGLNSFVNSNVRNSFEK